MLLLLLLLDPPHNDGSSPEAEPIASPLVSIVVLYLYLPDPHGAGHQHFRRVHGFKSSHSEIERSTTVSWACGDVAKPHTDG